MEDLAALVEAKEDSFVEEAVAQSEEEVDADAERRNASKALDGLMCRNSGRVVKTAHRKAL